MRKIKYAHTMSFPYPMLRKVVESSGKTLACPATPRGELIGCKETYDPGELP